MPVRQLPETIVNRIAAGEVVERPASVVKELVENAIDAGSSRIDVFSDGGGRRRIGITDDGDGMTHADLAIAVDRHATSKLDDEDLLRISTLGFRGEALPSIGAVARLAITTRHASEPHAWSMSVEGGAKSAIMPAALSRGTRVEVSDLFYATPARLKFLKTDRTEAEAIREVVRRLAMARPTSSGGALRRSRDRHTSMLAGHSVGAWWHQQEPVIARGNPRRLEEGMVIAMEPHVNHWHIQDMFVVRANGPELISDKFSTDEIFACGG
jgi:DNA mismatch repair protein MutL